MVSYLCNKKISSWACLEGLGLKLIFHWYAQLLVFNGSLFKVLTDKFVFWTIKNRVVSSAKSLRFDDNLFDNLIHLM